MKIVVRCLMVVAILAVVGTHANAQNCLCQPPVPACPPPDAACPGAAWTNGSLLLAVPVGTGTCMAQIYFCSRNITGTPCGYGVPYGVSCEYKLTKVCFPSDCEVDCQSFEMNSILQNVMLEVAKVNPHGHFVPTATQWNDPNSNYKTVWKLSFPACFQCEREPGTNCLTVTPCDNNSCYKWYEAYTCGPACPTAVPLCPNPCPGGKQFRYVPGSTGKTTGECQNPMQCILCGY